MSKFEKKDGAKMTCASCGNELICRMSSYEGSYSNKLQWQNQDGGAHYKTNDGKNYTCQDKDGNRIPPKPKQETPKTEEPQKCVHGIVLGQECPNCATPKPKDDRVQTLLNKFTVLEKDLKQIKQMVDANLAIASDAKVMLNDMVALP